MDQNLLKSPGGMRSYLPDIAIELEEVEKKIAVTFQSWGYQPVITPTLEYYDSLTAGIGAGLKKDLYKFIDYEGNILALRPEMTAPIARTISSRLNNLKLPLRLSYNASVFRYDQPQSGKNREIYQLGLELIGEKNDLADAEAIIIAIESLLKAGVKKFQIDIGHTGFLDGIINQTELDLNHKNRLKSFLVQRDLVGLRNYISNQKTNVENILLKLPLLRGDRQVFKLAREMVANSTSLEAVKNLEQINNYLTDYGFSQYINFDLSLIRGFNYYTGVVFEGFTEKLGYTICGGGRYDNLISQYSGKKVPAIGFAIGIERVRLALKKQGYCFIKPLTDAVIVFNLSVATQALKTARKLRDSGLNIMLLERDHFEQKLIVTGKNSAVRKYISFCNFKEKGQIEVYDSDKLEPKVFTEDQNWEELIWPK